MSRKNGGSFKFSYVLIFVGVILLLAIVGGFIAKFTNNFTSKFATFYVEHNGKTITSDRGGYAFDKDVEYRFDVGYSLDILNEEKLSYNVKVVPNITDKTDFVFEDENNRYKYSDITDLSAQFIITKYDDYFTLMADKLFCEVINSARDGIFTGIPTVDGSQDYLKLIISSVDSSESISLTFNINIPPEDITINYGHIVAG